MLHWLVNDDDQYGIGRHMYGAVFCIPLPSRRDNSNCASIIMILRLVERNPFPALRKRYLEFTI
jgi:hypothetical protein